MKKILNISSINIFPPQTGGAKVIHQYLKYIGSYQNVFLLTVKSRDKESKKELGNITIIDTLSNNVFVKFLGPMTFITLFKLIIAIKPDVLIIEFPWFGFYGLIMRMIFKIPFIIRVHNVENLRFKSMGKLFWPFLKSYEKLIYKNANEIICLSPVDKKIIINQFKINSKKIKLFPYVPNKDVFYPDRSRVKLIRNKLHIKNEPLILFFGPLDYQPNREAMQIIINIIAPHVWNKIPQTKFVIAGRNSPLEGRDNRIIFTDYVDRIEDYINASDLIIVPIISGGGIRTKIIEGLACRKKIISTSFGAQGIISTDFNNLLVLEDDWKKFSNKIISNII